MIVHCLHFTINIDVICLLQKLAYTYDRHSISITWKDFKDKESGIKGYRLSVWRVSSCWELDPVEQISEHVDVRHTVLNYRFREIEVLANVTYIVKIVCRNNAGLYTEDHSSPVLFDDSIPSAGTVVEGTDFRSDIVWLGSTQSVQGMSKKPR